MAWQGKVWRYGAVEAVWASSGGRAGARRWLSSRRMYRQTYRQAYRRTSMRTAGARVRSLPLHLLDLPLPPRFSALVFRSARSERLPVSVLHSALCSSTREPVHLRSLAAQHPTAQPTLPVTRADGTPGWLLGPRAACLRHWYVPISSQCGVARTRCSLGRKPSQAG